MAKKQRRKSKIIKDKTTKEDDVPIETKPLDEKTEDIKVEEETRGKKLLASIDAISDEDDDEDMDDENEGWNAEARALRQAIAEGVFDKLGKVSKIEEEDDDENDEEEEEEDDDEEEGEDEDVGKDGEVKLEDDSSEEEIDEEKGNEEKQKNSKKKEQVPSGIDKALVTITAELKLSKDKLPWTERYDVTPSTSLPFGKKNEDGQYIDIHDDLKREVIFYNMALEAVHEGRKKCTQNKIPFSRPEDFFAEMVKTDDHMAKVKDRLIFESKKIESFEQRKSNREQKLRAKEAHAHRLSEKAKSKKRHMQDVEDWAKSAASNRVGGNMVRDDDDEYLNRMNSGPNKKRQAMNKKYGFGGKKGRFKQNDRDSMNDMAGFNPKGNFSGGKKSVGTKRKGKRARDAAKARR